VSGAIGLVAVPPGAAGDRLRYQEKENRLDQGIWQVIDMAVAAMSA
jgi:hypothetical protein